MMNRSAVVYFCKPIGMIGPIKIGCTTYPKERLQQLMHWSPFDLEIAASVPGDFRLERLIHSIFYQHHIRHEWFHPCDALVSGIAQLQAGAAIEVAFDLTAPKGSIAKRRAGKVWTDWRRKLVSYSSRLRHASDRLGTETQYYKNPDDVNGILNSWRRDTTVTESQLARLDEVLADPMTHLASGERHVKKPVAANPREGEAA